MSCITSHWRDATQQVNLTQPRKKQLCSCFYLSYLFFFIEISIIFLVFFNYFIFLLIQFLLVFLFISFFLLVLFFLVFFLIISFFLLILFFSHFSFPIFQTSYTLAYFTYLFKTICSIDSSSCGYSSVTIYNLYNKIFLYYAIPSSWGWEIINQPL